MFGILNIILLDNVVNDEWLVVERNEPKVGPLGRGGGGGKHFVYTECL